MAEPYNLTGLNGQTDIFSFVNSANTVTGSLFGHLILVTGFVIMVMAFRNYEPKRAFATATFLNALFAIFLRLLGWIPDKTMFGCFILAGVSFVLLRWD